jgi:hypothetical protein
VLSARVGSPSPGGESAPFIYSSGVLPQGLGCGTGQVASLWFVISGLVRAKASRASAGPSWSCLTSAAPCFSARRFSRRGGTDMGTCADNLVLLIPALLRKTSGARIVTVMVTIPGTVSCPHARPGPKPTGDQRRGAGGIIGIRKQSHRDPKAEQSLWIGSRFQEGHQQVTRRC